MTKTIKINNRSVLVPEGFAFRKLRSGEFLVEYNGRSHYVTGGKFAGGSSKEWFVDNLGDQPILVSGPVEAVKLIAGA